VIRLRRVGPSQYATQDGRFRIERDDENLTECEHPLCDDLHQRFQENGVHWVAYTTWHIWDTSLGRDGDYAKGTYRYDTKREAAQVLMELLGTAFPSLTKGTS
jgi:hypothetical protein